jgi:ATP-dependent Clp protease ATP-binding subunit ClpA
VLGDPGLGGRLGRGILGQEEALAELIERLWQEAVCRPDSEPLRLMLAGPVGTGKSMATKRIADALGYPHHYIDASSFDSEHAVMTSLAGASPGIVNSYNDGVLARIARRPSVVEVADLEHARPGVCGALCEFFLRILQEGSLQTGSGMIIRTIPSLVFLFTTNVAYGTQKASTRVGFGEWNREEIRARVVSRSLEHLGHAFVSRVGPPILFGAFTRATAMQVARKEMETLVARVTGAEAVVTSEEAPRYVVDSLASLETGARGIIDAARGAVAAALRTCRRQGTRRTAIELRDGRIVIDDARPPSEGASTRRSVREGEAGAPVQTAQTRTRQGTKERSGQ